jgi:hypothetical protein
VKAFMVVTFVVTFFSGVSAEGTCAWILWSHEQEIYEKNLHTWMPSGYETRKECQEKMEGGWLAQLRVYEEVCAFPIPLQCKTSPKDTEKYSAACSNIACKNGGELTVIFSGSLMYAVSPHFGPSYIKKSEFTCLPDTVDPRTSER